MKFQETDSLSALGQITAVVTNSSNMVEILRSARSHLAEIIPYDFLAILVDDRDRECLTAPIAFNDRISPDNGELVITYDNSLISEVLITRKSRSRFSLSEHQGLIHSDISCDLLVPMCTPENVVGCLYFARIADFPFNVNEQENAEQAASMLAIVLERAKHHDEIRVIQDSTNRWQERYLILLEALPYPAVVTNLVLNEIEECNEAFEQLVGYCLEELRESNFSDIFPLLKQEKQLPIGQFQQHDGQITSLIHKDKNMIQVELSVGTVPLGSSDHCLLVFRPANHKRTEATRESDFNLFLLSCLQPSSDIHIIEALREPLDRLAVMWGPKYVSLMGHESDGSFHSLLAFSLSEGIRKELQEPWISSFSENPFLTILKTQQPAFVSDIKAAPAFKPLRAVATRFGYTSLVSLPLILKDKPFGLLNLFFESPRIWTDVDKEAFSSAARVICAVIENNKNYVESKTGSQRAEARLQLSLRLKSETRLENIIAIAAQVTIEQLNFDFFSVTLFNKKEEGLELFCIGSRELEQIFQSEWNWEQISDSELGRLVPTMPSTGSSETTDSNRFDTLSSAMNEKVSVLLLSQDNYLGNLALGRLYKSPFHSNDVEFVRQVASMVAEAIQNIHGGEFESSDIYRSTQHFQSNLLKLHTEHEIDTVIYLICMLTKEITGASECNVKLVDENFEDEAVSEIIPGVKEGLISRQSAAKLLENIKSTGRPLAIENASNFFGAFQENTSLTSWQGLGSYFIFSASIDDKPVAIISIAWEEQHTISPSERMLVGDVAAHAAVALTNAKSYQQTLEDAKEKEDFAFTVSHDLKAPLSSVKSLTQFLLDDYKDSFDEDGLQYLSRIHKNVEHMEDFIHNLLDCMRLGRVTRSFSLVSAADIIAETLETLSGEIEKANVVIKISENLPVLFCDASAITQVFINLISNAIKHTRDDTPNPLIIIDYLDKDKLCEEFVVGDNGIGIAEEYHDKIFSLFFTVADEANSKSTGVGLATVKKIVENHGGRIWVSSSLGRGAEFHFTIAKNDVGAEK